MSLIINDFCSLIWVNEEGEYHREKGPAFITAYGHIGYYFNGQPHRLDGPARTYASGHKYYQIHGRYYSKEEYYAKVKKL